MKWDKVLPGAMLVSSLFLIATPPALAAGDANKGKSLYARCATCHSLKPGVNMIGPSLSKMWGRTAGTSAKFNYSPAMKKYAKAWNVALLDAYIRAPSKTVPGTRMVFAGMPNAKDREDLIAYLQQAAK
ncbi:MAG: c-type cytochrome [Sphingobium sp.]|nr:c-type cytochrome [Sphingobium sp.]